MRIAVTSENGQVFQHFGRTPEFTIAEVKDGKVTKCETVPTGDCGHGALAGFLKDRKIDLLICGGLGGGAQMALAEAGIQLVAGAEGDVEKVIRDYLGGALKTNPDFACHHHDGGTPHACGEHGCR